MSQIVTLHAKPRFVTLPNEVHNETIVKFGSFFREGTAAPARGLTPEEEKHNLPDYIGVSPNDQSWNHAVRNFWAEISIAIPVVGGQNLYIDHDVISKKITKQIIEKGEFVTKEVNEEVRVPVNLVDFCIYELCKISSECATTESELQDKEAFAYSISNPQQEAKEKAELYQAKKEATKVYVKLASDSISLEDKQIRSSLIKLFKNELVLASAYPIYSENEEYNQMQSESAIKTISDSMPLELVKAMNDPLLKVNAEIHYLLDKGQIIKEGNTYFNEDNEIIAGNLEALRRFIQAKSDTGEVLKMKAKAEHIEQNQNKLAKVPSKDPVTEEA
jgi:hypothetical protein